MKASQMIHTATRITPMIYAYTTPGYPKNDGWTKIGYTEQGVKKRVEQQTHTAGLDYEILWSDFARYKDDSGEFFKDYDFHHFLEMNKKIPRRKGTEWFQISGWDSQRDFFEFASRRYLTKAKEGMTYTLRREQAEAVARAKVYFEKGGKEFLWNAKPRFGKTLAAYDLVRKMQAQNVLIVTNRPSIANSWLEDFRKFIAWQEPILFVSETDALKGKAGVLSHEEYVNACLNEDKAYRMVAFESLQGLKGSAYFAKDGIDKLKWIADLSFDLVIVDESQEGVDTKKTDWAFGKMKKAHTLYLSGTPFKQLARGDFAEDQVYNWSYADEQEAKASWTGDGYNPYEDLPKLTMLTYQMSPMIMEKITQGADMSDEGKTDYAFDLNEFFAVNESGQFVHKEEVRKFLVQLRTGAKYPFSTPELRKELAHTMWYLNRVAAARALRKLLKEDPVFKDYEVIMAVGDGRQDEEDETNDKAYERVKQAIKTHDKTITLTVGQLTVGVTVKEWSAVLMLCNLESPSSYMQAAFRAQNPCRFQDEGGKMYRKENAYVFDFDPARTLIIFDQFANDLLSDTAGGSGTADDRRQNIKRLLNFFPVIGEDSDGEMVELDAAKVLSIPRKLKSTEVVRRGFLSNFLFQNISNVFGAPAAVKEIIEKLPTAQEEQKKKDDGAKDLGSEDKPFDEEGNRDVESIVIGKTPDIFGDKIYEKLADDVEKPLQDVAQHTLETGNPVEELTRKIDTATDAVADTLISDLVPKVVATYGATKARQKRMENDIRSDVKGKVEEKKDQFIQGANLAKLDMDRKVKEAEGDAKKIAEAHDSYGEVMDGLINQLKTGIQETVQKTIQEKPKELIRQMEEHKAAEEKKSIETSIRDHLRGFSRAIPSFLMAYGDRKLTLANLDDYTEDEVFYEVTNITEEEFRFLRDGGDRLNPETGKVEHFKGHLFDETVFNDAVQEFLNKKEALANYFDESQEEDIFDYIPPQQTNQIFTPRWVVEKMVDELEEENPGCFDDPKATFADLYMKSGLYITEIVKRLYRSEKMKKLYPDSEERIRHILANQVYGMAPTRIIYLIATNYIMGFDERFKENNPHFVQEDAAEAAKNGCLAERVNAHFGV